MITSLVEALGWTLLHSLWQVSLVAFVFLMVRPLLRTATNVYGGGVVALLFIIGWSWYTAVEVYEPPSTSTVTPRFAPAPSAFSQAPLFSLPEIPLVGPAASTWTERIARWINPYLSWLVTGWLVGMLLLSTRLVGGLWYLSRLRRYHTTPLPDWETTLSTLLNRLRLRRPVTLLSSAMAKTPMVVGYLKPVILLPVELMSSLPAEQIEAIIAHELAHVRRYDYGLNLLQSWVEIFFFYHPAVWWLSSVVREEREKCCDDIAVSVCGSRVVYAQALSEAQALASPATALALAFGSRKSGLLARIERLVHPPSSPGSPAIKLLSLTTLLLLTVFLLAGETFARKAEKGEQWLVNTFYPSAQRSARSTSDTLAPAQPSETDDGWRSSDKAKAYAPPTYQDTLPPAGEQNRTTTRKAEQDRLSFSLGNLDSADVEVYIDWDEEAHPSVYYFDTDEAKNQPPIRLDLVNWGENEEEIADQIARLSVSVHDSLPTLSWNDSLWREPLSDLSDQMAGLSEELKEFLTDSVDTYELQRQLGDVQYELGRLQAELITSLRRSFNEGRLEELQEILQEKEERLQQRMEQMERAMEQRQSRERHLQKGKEKVKIRVHRDYDSTIDRLEQALLADGLIEKKQEYRFELKPRGLYINRKKQKSDLAQKYRRLLEVSEGTSFSIVRVAE